MRTDSQSPSSSHPSRTNSIPSSPSFPANSPPLQSSFSLSTAPSPGALEFGFVPAEIVQRLRNSADWKQRSSAIETLQTIVGNLDDSSALLPKLTDLLHFLSILLEDPNFKISLTSLYIIGDLVTKVGLSIKPYLSILLPMLILKFADNKFVIRQANFKVIAHLMLIMTPRPILAVCLHYLSHEVQKIREEIVDVVITALLMFPRFEFDFPFIMTELLTALRDAKAKVKYVAVEAYAIIAQRITAAKVLEILRGYGIDDDTLELLQMRFTNLMMPVLNSDGLVDHIISARSTAPSPRASASGVTSFSSISSASTVTSSSMTPSPIPGFYPPMQSVHNSPTLTELSKTSRQAPVKSAPTVLTRQIPEYQFVHPGYNLYSPERIPYPKRYLSAGQGKPKTKLPWESDKRFRGEESKVPTENHLRSHSVPYDSFINKEGIKFESTAVANRFASPQYHIIHLPGALEAQTQTYRPVNIPFQSSTYDQLAEAPLKLNSDIGAVEPIVKSNPSESKRRFRKINPPADSLNLVAPENQRSPLLSNIKETNRKNNFANSSTDATPRNFSSDVMTNGKISWRSNGAPTNLITGYEPGAPTSALLPTHSLNSELRISTSPAVNLSKSRTVEINPSSDSNQKKNIVSPSPSSAAPISIANSPKFTSPPSSPTSVPLKQRARSKSLSPAKASRSPSITDSANDFKSALATIKETTDWTAKCAAIETIHMILTSTPSTVLSRLHELTLMLIAESQNLRSAVSKVALSCVSDMLKHHGRSMDAPDLDITITMLLKKLGDNNNFISETVDSALQQVVSNIPYNRCIPSILNSADSKNSNIRAKIAELLVKIITSLSPSTLSKYAANHHDMGKIIPVLYTFLRDGNVITKNHSKRILFVLGTVPEWDKIMEKVVSGANAAAEIRAAIISFRTKQKIQTNRNGKTEETSGIGPDHYGGNHETVLVDAPPATSESIDPLPSVTFVGVECVPKAKELKRRHTFKQGRTLTAVNKEQLCGVEYLDEILRELGANEWKKRSASLTKLQELVLTRPENLKSSAVTVRICDVLLERLHDGNSKVNLLALQVLCDMIKVLKNYFDPVISLLIPKLSNNLSTTNTPVRTAAIDVVDLLIAHVDLVLLIQSMGSVLQYGNNVRVKPLVIEKLIQIFETTIPFDSEPSLRYPPRLSSILKHILPFSVKFLSESSPISMNTDLKTLNTRLIRTMYNVYGNTLFDVISTTGIGVHGLTGITDVVEKIRSVCGVV
ncbi:armadillo-type protein [Paraphysoderma sedebokerense]|nr:armadillo-type protein [Paraphysoderma sedebokerense]